MNRSSESRVAGWRQILIVSLLAMSLVGCVGSGTLLYDVSIAPTTISPDADGVEDVAAIRYKVAEPCLLTITFEGPGGQRHVFREEKRRSPGAYEALFGGHVGGRALPDGTYAVVLEAVGLGSAASVRWQGSVTIVGADTILPELQDFTVFPQQFTPNQDGITDRVRVSYVLTKAADVRVWIENAKGEFVTSVLEDEKNPVEPGQPGRHQYDYDAGVDADAPPPPDGAYTVIGEARDRAGNVVRATAPLTIVEGGVPRATIQWAEITPSIVPLGEVISVTARVKNVGTVPIRTTGPAPGTAYTTQESFNSKGFPQESGAFRLGADFDTNVSGLGYPYRWRLGTDDELATCEVEGRSYLCLMPGATASAFGTIRVVDKPLRRSTYFFVGLFHEDVRKVEGEVEPTRVIVEY